MLLTGIIHVFSRSTASELWRVGGSKTVSANVSTEPSCELTASFSLNPLPGGSSIAASSSQNSLLGGSSIAASSSQNSLLGGSSIAASSSQNSLPGGSSIAASSSQNSLPGGSSIAASSSQNSLLGGSSIAASSSQNSLPGGSSIAASSSQNSLPGGSSLVCLREEDAPGASLNGREPSQLKVVERWLKYRAATQLGRSRPCEGVSRLYNNVIIIYLSNINLY